MTCPDYDWEAFTRRLDAAIERLISELCVAFPHITRQSATSSNEGFCFRYYASISTSESGFNEAAVFSLDVKRTCGGPVFEADLSRADGVIWWDAPVFCPGADPNFEEGFMTWLCIVEDLLVSNAQLVGDRLASLEAGEGL